MSRIVTKELKATIAKNLKVSMLINIVTFTFRLFTIIYENNFVVGLTASILNSKCSTPQELDDKMHSLEKTLRSVAETATDMVMSDVYGAKPQEIVLGK